MKKLRLNEFPKTNNDLKRGKESQIWVYYVLIQQSPTLSTEDTFQEPQGMSEIVDSTKLHIYYGCFFPIQTYL